MSACLLQIDCLSKIRKSKHRVLTLPVLSDRVQVVKMVEEPSPVTYATPPDCEQKKRRGRKGRERERVERTSKEGERSQKVTSERPQYPRRRSTGKSSNTNMPPPTLTYFIRKKRSKKKKQETHVFITTGQRQSFHL